MASVSFNSSLKRGIHKCRSTILCWSPTKIHELTWASVKGMDSCKPICGVLFICWALLGDKVEKGTIILRTIAS